MIKVYIAIKLKRRFNLLCFTLPKNKNHISVPMWFNFLKLLNQFEPLLVLSPTVINHFLVSDNTNKGETNKLLLDTLVPRTRSDLKKSLIVY